jgi:hypothetical protein
MRKWIGKMEKFCNWIFFLDLLLKKSENIKLEFSVFIELISLIFIIKIRMTSPLQWGFDHKNYTLLQIKIFIEKIQTKDNFQFSTNFLLDFDEIEWKVDKLIRSECAWKISIKMQKIIFYSKMSASFSWGKTKIYFQFFKKCMIIIWKTMEWILIFKRIW